jgi:hypothetical protein
MAYVNLKMKEDFSTSMRIVHSALECKVDCKLDVSTVITVYITS